MTNINFTVLLVEDSKHDQRFVRRAWEKNNITNPLDVVTNGQECLAYLHQEGKYVNKLRPGIVLMDIRMPVMDGIEALQAIRADQDLKHMPVIMLTTSQEDADLIKSYDLGCNSFVQKPVDFDGLAEAVRAIHAFWTLSKLPPT
ncbi:MAG: response regulator [Anaerolineales bacterium]|nr:response regulator [Anaerolineales bacterium]